MDVNFIADLALSAALAGENAKVDLPIDWPRPHGFPFPAIRPKVGDADGVGTWEWQPCSLILWVTTTRANERKLEKTP